MLLLNLSILLEVLFPPLLPVGILPGFSSKTHLTNKLLPEDNWLSPLLKCGQ